MEKEGALWCFLNPCSVLNIAAPLTFAPTDIQCLLTLASIFFESVASLQFMLIKVKHFSERLIYLYDCLLKTFRSELVVFVFCVNSSKECPGKTIYFNFDSIFGDFFWNFLKKRWVIIWADLIPMFYMSGLIIMLKTSTRGTVCRAVPKL